MSIYLQSIYVPRDLTKIIHQYQGPDLDLEAVGALPEELSKKIFSFSENQDLGALSLTNRRGHQLTAGVMKARKVTQVTWPREALVVAREILQGVDPARCGKQSFEWPLNAKMIHFTSEIPAPSLPNFENHREAIARMVALTLQRSCLLHPESFPSIAKDLNYFLMHQGTVEDRATIEGLFKVRDDAYESSDFLKQFDLEVGINLLNQKERRVIRAEDNLA